MLGLILAFVRCSDPPSGLQHQIVVAAAADLTLVLPELGRGFEAQSGVKVVPSFGPSGSLAQQIANGAPFDVFLSADRKFLDRLVESRHVDPASRRVYAVGRLVLFAPTIKLTSFEQLRSPAVRRVSIANPETAPYGRAAKQALERSGLWREMEPKIVFAENVRQALQMAETGNTDVAITALSLTVSNATAAANFPVPPQHYDEIQQEAGLVIRPKSNSDGQTFLDYLAGPAGKQTLEKYGFSFAKAR